MAKKYNRGERLRLTQRNQWPRSCQQKGLYELISHL